MSFTIQAAGKVPDAIEQIKAVSYTGDTSQLDAVRALILAELEAWPTGENAMKGVFVEANGHHSSIGSRSLTISIRPLWLRGA